MHRHSIRWIALALVVAHIGCDGDSPTAPLLPEGPVTVVELYHSSDSGFDDQERQVIRTPAAFESIWNGLDSMEVEPLPLPQVDFNLYMVLLVSSGFVPDGCHSIEIADAVADGTDLTVTVVEEVSDMTCSCTAVVGEPTILARVPRANEVVFENITQSSCSTAS